MVRAARAEFRKPGRVLRVHEAQDFFVVLDGADEALLLGDLAAQPRQDLGESRAAGGLVERLVFRAAEGLGVAAFGLIFLLDVLRGFFDEIEASRS